MKKPLPKIVARDTKQLGVAIARFRKFESLTQTQLSEFSGLLQKTVSALERGDSGTQLRTLFKMLGALNLELLIKKRGE